MLEVEKQLQNHEASTIRHTGIYCHPLVATSYGRRDNGTVQRETGLIAIKQYFLQSNAKQSTLNKSRSLSDMTDVADTQTAAKTASSAGRRPVSRRRRCRCRCCRRRPKRCTPLVTHYPTLSFPPRVTPVVSVRFSPASLRSHCGLASSKSAETGRRRRCVRRRMRFGRVGGSRHLVVGR